MDFFKPPFDPCKLYKKFLIDNNLYNDNIYNIGCNYLKNDNTIDATHIMKIYKSNLLGEKYVNWKDYYIRHSLVFKIFTRYLKENNLYHQFFKNLINKRIIIYFDFFSNFLWSNTKERFLFWCKESDKWLKLYNNINKIIKYHELEN